MQLRFLMYASAKRGALTIEANLNTIDHLAAVRLRHYGMRFPANGERQTIVAFLDRQEAKINDPLAKVRRAIARLKKFHASLISAAVSGKIDLLEAVPQ